MKFPTWTTSPTPVETLADSVDWVIVRNPVKIPTTKFFQGSELEAQLMDCGAARLEIPALLSDTRNHLRSREIQIGRGLSPAEALKNPRRFNWTWPTALSSNNGLPICSAASMPSPVI